MVWVERAARGAARGGSGWAIATRILRARPAKSSWSVRAGGSSWSLFVVARARLPNRVRFSLFLILFTFFRLICRFTTFRRAASTALAVSKKTRRNRRTPASEICARPLISADRCSASGRICVRGRRGVARSSPIRASPCRRREIRCSREGRSRATSRRESTLKHTRTNERARNDATRCVPRPRPPLHAFSPHVRGARTALRSVRLAAPIALGRLARARRDAASRAARSRAREGRAAETPPPPARPERPRAPRPAAVNRAARRRPHALRAPTRARLFSRAPRPGSAPRPGDRGGARRPGAPIHEPTVVERDARRVGRHPAHPLAR